MDLERLQNEQRFSGETKRTIAELPAIDTLSPNVIGAAAVVVVFVVDDDDRASSLTSNVSFGVVASDDTVDGADSANAVANANGLLAPALNVVVSAGVVDVVVEFDEPNLNGAVTAVVIVGIVVVVSTAMT
jgi:hypothetical protein